MKNIIVGFSRPRKWKPFAELIMWWDKSNISHTYSKFDSVAWGVGFIYQNSGHKTNFEGSELFYKNNIPIEEYAILVPDEVEHKIGRLCVSREGIKYAISQIIGIALANIIYYGSFGKIKTKNFLAKENETDCLEEIAIILKEGLGLESNLDLDLSTVKQFREWIASLPQATKIVGGQ